MARHSHLHLRNGAWYWRRRLPRDLSSSGQKAIFGLSLGTSDRRLAVHRGIALDFALEEIRAMTNPPGDQTIRGLLARLRNDMLLQAETERAHRAPPQRSGLPPLRSGTNHSVLVQSSLEEILRGPISAMPTIDDVDLVEEQPLGRMPKGPRRVTDGNSSGDCGGDDGVERLSHGGLPDDLAKPKDRAAFYQGLSRFLERAARDNDLELAQEMAKSLLNRCAPTLAPSDADFRLLQRGCLRTAAEAHQINAQRELGNYESVLNDASLDILMNAGGARPDAPPLPVETTVPANAAYSQPSIALSEALKYCVKEKKDASWDDKSIRDAGTAVRLFVSFLGRDPLLHEISEHDAMQFKLALRDVPRLHGKGRFAGKSLQEAIALADELETAINNGVVCPDNIYGLERAGDIDDEDAAYRVERLALKSVNKHLTFLRVILDKCRAYRGGNKVTPFDDLLYSKADVERNRRIVRVAFKQEELHSLFATPAWTGCESAAARHRPGSLILKDSLYWVPLIGTYSGARMEEILQLWVEDVKEIEGVPFLDIRSGTGRRLKRPWCARPVPVHSRLQKLGFLEYVEEQRQHGVQRLFPDVKRGGSFDTLSHHFTMDWTKYRRDVGVYDKGKDFHCFRTTMNTNLLNKRVNDGLIKALLGHKPEGMTDKVYMSGYWLNTLQSALEEFDVEIGLNRAGLAQGR